MGVEPTRDSDYCPADGFEDREAHRDPSASMGACGWPFVTTNHYEYLF